MPSTKEFLRRTGHWACCAGRSVKPACAREFEVPRRHPSKANQMHAAWLATGLITVCDTLASDAVAQPAAIAIGHIG